MKTEIDNKINLIRLMKLIWLKGLQCSSSWTSQAEVLRRWMLSALMSVKASLWVTRRQMDLSRNLESFCRRHLDLEQMLQRTCVHLWPSGSGDGWRPWAGVRQDFKTLQVGKTPSWNCFPERLEKAQLNVRWTHLIQVLEEPGRSRQAEGRVRKKPHTRVRTRAQHPPETGASWEVVERRRLIPALRKQSQRILGRRFTVNKMYKVVENSQNLMYERVDLYQQMFLSRFLCFCRTQLQKLRILKIHFNLTLLL